MTKYQVLLSPVTLQKVENYLDALKTERISAGVIFSKVLAGKRINEISAEEFVELLVNTKYPQIFAESAIHGDGTDWNQSELSILGDISIAVPVTVYDNGKHYQPKIHLTPFEATLLYVPGALLRNDKGNTPTDYEEVTKNDQIDFNGLFDLYERRLLPPFFFANNIAKNNNKKAFITIPGLGCGQFAGKFRGSLEPELKNVLVKFLKKYSTSLLNIKAVYYDPYQNGDNERMEIDQISILVRPLVKGNEEKTQLCKPLQYEEDGDDFSSCELFSIVAWDHVSWPGNDFFAGSRSTDDGVKAAATNSMAVITGVEGIYKKTIHQYAPPDEYHDWGELVRRRKIQLSVEGNLIILPPA
jgi:hypothetical protein